MPLNGSEERFDLVTVLRISLNMANPRRGQARLHDPRQYNILSKL
jgi:hypothetical protein